MTHAGKVLLIMDERAGRAAAKEKELRVIGTAAIIGLGTGMKQLEHLILLTPTLSVTAPALLSAIAPCIALPPASVQSSIRRGSKLLKLFRTHSLAKKQGLIASARAVFEVLHRSDFRIAAAVINQVLVSVNE